MFETAVRREAVLREALADADIAPMLMVLAHLGGDLTILDEVAPHIHGAWSFMEAVPEALKQTVRDRLVAVLKDYAATGRGPPSQIRADALQRIMSAGVGQAVPAAYIPLLIEEIRLGAVDSRAVRWRRDGVVAAGFKVVIVGAGLSGLCAAVRLKELGVPFVILEKNQAVGGTWLENRYPGCAVDTPNHFYSYSFHPNEDWTRHFSGRDEILGYINVTADKYDLRRHIRFGVEVTGAVFDEASLCWRVATRAADGSAGTLVANAMISAVGQLNRPSIPKIEGIERFRGRVFHTAEWEDSVDLRGKRVAMIGTGASAVQVGPAIAPGVGTLVVFQRSRHWVANSPNYHRGVSAGNRWAIKHIPYFAKWMRFLLFWGSSDGFHASLRVDPDWTQPEVSLNAANHAMRETLIAHMRAELEGDEALLDKLVPPYPPHGKRMLGDNNWFKMLKRRNVALVTEAIECFTEDGIVTADGAMHPVDVVVMATGFQASRMLWPMEITGRAGRTIREVWGDDDPRAYLGITVPGFPNLFLTFGPNTNLAHGGSTIFHTECQVRYIAQALRDMIENGQAAVEVRPEVHDAYNQRVDAVCDTMVWAHPGVTSWYKNGRNRVTVTSPWTLLEYWTLTRQYDAAAYRSYPGRVSVGGMAAE